MNHWLIGKISLCTLGLSLEREKKRNDDENSNRKVRDLNKLVWRVCLRW